MNVHIHARTYAHTHTRTHTHTHTQWFKAPKKVKTRASEALPVDPELQQKINEIDRLSEMQVNDKLQAMLVSYIIMMSPLLFLESWLFVLCQRDSVRLGRMLLLYQQNISSQ